MVLNVGERYQPEVPTEYIEAISQFPGEYDSLLTLASESPRAPTTVEMARRVTDDDGDDGDAETREVLAAEHDDGDVERREVPAAEDKERPRVIGESGFSRAPNGDASEYEEVVVYGRSLLRFDGVAKYITSRGCAFDNATCLHDYVPKKIVFRVWWDRVAGAVGAHASGGWIATNLVNYRTYPYGEWPSGVAIGLLLVFNLTGHVRQCTVNGVDGFGPFPGLGYDQVKPVDPETFVLGPNANRSGFGVPGLWRWRTGELEALGSVEYDGHDVSAGWRTPYIQHASDDDGVARGALDGFWAISNFSKTATASGEDVILVLANATSGATSAATSRLDAPGEGINHAQLVDEDRLIIFNVNKGTDPTMFCAYNVSARAREWCAGGLTGDFRLFDAYGVEYSRHDGFFHTSHNLEYFGEDEFMIFANNVSARRGASVVEGAASADRGANRSAMVVMRLERDAANRANSSLRIVWWHQTPHASIYGDTDRLPSGNLLGVHWPTTIDAPPSACSYESRMVEIVRETHELAWEATVFGQYPCPSYPCDRTEAHGFAQPEGWAQYQLERFYDTPLVADAVCARAGDDDDFELSFTAWNQFKQDNPVRYLPLALAFPHPRHTLRPPALSFFPLQYPGTFRVTSSSSTHTGDFFFKAHWRPAKVAATLHGKFSEGDVLTLVVKNLWGVETEGVQVTCATAATAVPAKSVKVDRPIALAVELLMNASLDTYVECDDSAYAYCANATCVDDSTIGANTSACGCRVESNSSTRLKLTSETAQFVYSATYRQAVFSTFSDTSGEIAQLAAGVSRDDAETVLCAAFRNGTLAREAGFPAAALLSTSEANWNARRRLDEAFESDCSGGLCVNHSWASGCSATCICSQFGKRTSACTDNASGDRVDSWTTPSELFDLIRTMNASLNTLAALPADQPFSEACAVCTAF